MSMGIIKSGEYSKVAGNAAANVAEIREGTGHLTMRTGQNFLDASVAFSDPMSDTDYAVDISFITASGTSALCRVQEKTETGFKVEGYVCNDNDVTNYGTDGWYFKYIAWKPIKLGDVEVVTPEYIRNQNILSDWENIELSSSGLHPTIMQYDGIVTVYAKNYITSNDFAYIRVNKVACNSWFVPNGFSVPANILAVSAVVKKGDGVTVHFPTNSSPYTQARFYKLRDYSGR